MCNIEEVREVLFAFVKRVASKEATPEEVGVLPGVAKVLLESFKD